MVLRGCPDAPVSFYAPQVLSQPKPPSGGGASLAKPSVRGGVLLQKLFGTDSRKPSGGVDGGAGVVDVVAKPATAAAAATGPLPAAAKAGQGAGPAAGSAPGGEARTAPGDVRLLVSPAGTLQQSSAFATAAAAEAPALGQRQRQLSSAATAHCHDAVPLDRVSASALAGHGPAATKAGSVMGGSVVGGSVAGDAGRVDVQGLLETMQAVPAKASTCCQ